MRKRQRKKNRKKLEKAFAVRMISFNGLMYTVGDATREWQGGCINQWVPVTKPHIDPQREE